MYVYAHVYMFGNLPCTASALREDAHFVPTAPLCRYVCMDVFMHVSKKSALQCVRSVQKMNYLQAVGLRTCALMHNTNLIYSMTYSTLPSCTGFSLMV